MGLEHQGLSDLLRKEAKIQVSSLPSDHMILVMNKRRSACKVLVSGGSALIYLRNMSGSPLSLSQIRSICTHFGGPRLMDLSVLKSIFASEGLKVA